MKTRWACALLSQCGETQDRIAAEASGLDLTAEDAMGRLVHTTAAVNETLRLFPPAFTVVREAIAPDRIGALDLPRPEARWRAVLTTEDAGFCPDPKPVACRLDGPLPDVEFSRPGAAILEEVS